MIRTYEYVSPNHPDKLCDRISDAILDACMAQDNSSRVAIETMAGHGIVTLTGEITTDAYVDVRKIVQQIIGKPVGIQANLVQQSPEIAQGVDTGGAGDQGIVVGYACWETPQLMPYGYMMARALCRYIWETEKGDKDGKVQLTFNDNCANAQGKFIPTHIVASFERIDKIRLKQLVMDYIFGLFGHEESSVYNIDIQCNPAGDWDVGGIEADTGVTGRKIVVDAYGPYVPVGGGAFSGKDPTKVDRSGAYWARKVAVDYLLSKGEDTLREVTVRFAYGIGIEETLQAEIVAVNAQGGVQYIDIKDHPQYDLEVADMIAALKLPNFTQYHNLAAFGHFGNNNLWDKPFSVT